MSIICNSSIRSKWLKFKVAIGMSFVMAVDAMNKSAISICFLFFFNLELIKTAVFTQSSLNGITSINLKISSQNWICFSEAPE